MHSSLRFILKDTKVWCSICFRKSKDCTKYKAVSQYETGSWLAFHVIRKRSRSTNKHQVVQASGTYGSRARCGSFHGGIWLAWYFLNTTVTNESFSVIFHLPDYKAINNTMQH